MKLISKSLALLCLGITSTFAIAEQQTQFIDYAKVQDVRPVYRLVEHRTPEKNCWIEQERREYQHRARNNSTTSTLIGGLIGGAIGHHVGHGSDNKKIGAAVGTVLGMSIGNDAGRQHRPHREVRYENVERCEVNYRTETEERLTAYDVTYKYRGETLTTRMKKHPGERIKIAVTISPVSDY